MSQNESALTDVIRQEILHGRKVALEPEQDLLSDGILDSLGILRVVSFIEQKLGVKVPDEDVVFENFNSIRAMADYVAQHGTPTA
jgi:acyl carrier protein